MSARTWAPDSSVTECPLCKHKFSVVVRKHHCRRCGNVYCGKCTSHKAPLTTKRFQRVCIKCFLDLGHMGEQRQERPAGAKEMLLEESNTVDLGETGHMEKSDSHLIMIESLPLPVAQVNTPSDYDNKHQTTEHQTITGRKNKSKTPEDTSSDEDDEEPTLPRIPPSASNLPPPFPNRAQRAIITLTHKVNSTLGNLPSSSSSSQTQNNQSYSQSYSQSYNHSNSNGHVEHSYSSIEERAAIWFYLDKDDKEKGPMSKIDLREAWNKGALTEATYIWNRTMKDWVKIGDDQLLKNYFVTPSPPPPPLEPMSPPPHPKRKSMSVENGSQPKKWWHKIPWKVKIDPAEERLLENSEQEKQMRSKLQFAATRNQVLYSAVWFVSTGCLIFIFSVFGGSSWFSVFVSMTCFYNIMTFLIFWYDRCLEFGRSATRISPWVLFLHVWWCGFVGGWCALFCCTKRNIPLTAKCIALSVFNLFWLAFYLNLQGIDK